MDDASNADLLRRVSDGETDAWDTLVARYAQTVWRVTAHYGFDNGLREDVVQTVWLKLHDKAGTVRDPQRLAGWLCQVARNECINVVRRRRREFSLADRWDTESEDAPVSRGIELDDDRRLVLEVFNRLDARCRELLTLSIVDPPIGYDEIARILDMSRGSVGPTRQRCLDKMRKAPAMAQALLHERGANR